jgi:SAM-dependent methyltransferase
MTPTPARLPLAEVSARLKQDVVRHYERELARHGPTARGMDWKDEASQRLRFEILCDVCELAGTRIYEVGAGAGHLYDFLSARGIAAEYAGADLSRDMVEAARRRHPGVSFEHRDILVDPPATTHDIVFCSGLFHVKLDHDDAEWWAFVQQMLCSMYALARVGIAFNVMSDSVDFRAPTLFYPDREELLGFCRRQLSPFVVLRDDYPLYECTVYVYREAAAVSPRPKRPGSLSVIMPGLNEELSIEGAVRRMVAALERAVEEFEIIVIDDGSTDRTGEIAERLAAEDPRVRVIRNERNLNYGVSLARGIAAARCDWILHCGMDLPLAPEDIAKFTAHFADADVVVARRTHRGAHSPWRKLTSWTNNLLLRGLFAPRTVDLNFTQFYRRSFAQAVRLTTTGPATVTPELILTAERTGRRVREVSVEFRRRERGAAHFGRPRDILWTLRDLGRLRLRTWLRGWER